MYRAVIHIINVNRKKKKSLFAVNHCTADIAVNFSTSITFIPPQGPKTGTAFFVICAPSHLPPTASGTMVCDNQGFWQNAPQCVMESSTANSRYTTDSKYTMMMEHTTSPAPGYGLYMYIFVIIIGLSVNPLGHLIIVIQIFQNQNQSMI